MKTASDLLPQFDGVKRDPVPSRYLHAIHAYHGIDAWDPSGKRLLYAGLDSPDSADIVVRDLATGEERAVASSNAVNFHTACEQRWALGGDAVVYEQRDQHGNPVPHIVPSDGSGSAEPIPGLERYIIRHLVKGGTVAYAHLRPAEDDLVNVVRSDITTGEKDTIFDVREPAAMLPDDLREPGVTYFISHPVSDEHEEWMLFKLMQRGPGTKPPRYVTFFTRHLPTGRMVHHGPRVHGHPFWDPVTGKILNIAQDGESAGTQPPRQLVLQDPATGAVEEFVPERIEGPGHPSISPDGRWMATDSFVEDRNATIYLFDRRSGGRWKLATLDHPWKPQKIYDPSLIRRGQPHPVWSPDSTSLLVNCNMGGTRYVLHLLSGFTGERGDQPVSQ